ncbi:ATP-binding protein [Ramlibacter sp. AN1015]|uniref:sensor histidine kinase n=1 Tax=Ramlibacter sp. AN1015 TaxID=3133428 RepID=UPI0030C07E43
MSVAPWGALPREVPAGQSSAFVRLWRGFANARVVVASVLLLVLAALFSVVQPAPANDLLLGICLLYLIATVCVRLVERPPRRELGPLWLATIGIDLVAISVLQYMQAGGMTFMPLFAVPVLMASVLGAASLAFGTAAAVALLLLAEAWLRAAELPAEAAQRFFQAGLTGLGYFALAALAYQLSGRLAREEEKSRESEEAARLQAQVNELVIESLADGILVVDARGRIRAANPTACAVLGVTVGNAPGMALSQEAGWLPLLELTQRTVDYQAMQLSEIALHREGEPPRRVLVRTRLAGTEADGRGGLCVVFLEDLRELEARLRTEKLAAMGRMSAAVAHEIRNPLAAITQANALLDEELSDAGQRQLSALVRQNAQRLAQIVDEVLDVARVRQHAPSHAEPVALDAAIAVACDEWAAASGASGRMFRRLRTNAHQVVFEPAHLRRVLVNLLDNAARHAGPAPDAIQVATGLLGGQASLRVWSDGAPLDPSVQRHLFEPFFSSQSRSSGLGLYICRELCERHGAQIGYRRCRAPLDASREGNEFFVHFRTAPGRAAGVPTAAARIQG